MKWMAVGTHRKTNRTNKIAAMRIPDDERIDAEQRLIATGWTDIRWFKDTADPPLDQPDADPDDR